MENMNKKIVLAFGTFDVIHPGHIYFLKQAKKLGILTVSVASDKSVVLRKISSPLKHIDERIKQVQALGIADYVSGGDTKLNNWTIVKKLKPNIIAVGYDQIDLERALINLKKKFKYNFELKKISPKNPKKNHSSLISKNCVFCTIPEIKERTIIENKYAFAFPTNIPVVPGHLLICPKRCVEKIDDMTKLEIDSVLDLLGKLKAALKKTFGSEGFNVAWNEDEVGGQSVPHFHLHLLPRTKGDKGITKYDPRKFLYRPGSREKTPEKELSEISKLIIKNL